MRRVELTHDVLCGVVRSSRNLRHEREARDEAELQLAAQQERAAETRRTLHKTRRFAMIAAGLMLVALVSAVYGWINWNRARAADQQAQRARGDFKAGNPKLYEAWAIFDKLRAGGDKSEQVAVGLALSKFTRFSSWGVSGAPGSKVEDLQEAADLLRPWAKAAGTSAETRMLYADTSDSQARHSLRLGKVADAEKLETEIYAIAEKVLAQRPGDLRSMANRALEADRSFMLQGRAEEARQITEAEIARYRGELNSVANGLSFNRDLAYALYVDALTRPEGEPRRAAELLEATRRLDLLSAEANQLLDIRELRGWIAAA